MERFFCNLMEKIAKFLRAILGYWYWVSNFAVEVLDSAAELCRSASDFSDCDSASELPDRGSATEMSDSDSDSDSDSAIVLCDSAVGLCLNDLPEEVLSNIFVRIPAESLVKMKPLCKLWYRLISCSYFVNAHLVHQQINLQPSLFFKDSLMLKIEEDGRLIFKDFECTIPPFAIRSSCNGLLLFHHWNTLYIFNHITGRVHSLTDESILFSNCWSLVYDASIRKYKVIGIFSPKLGLPSKYWDCHPCCVMFTLPYRGLPEERKVFHLPSNYYLHTVPFFAKEKMHWLASHVKEEYGSKYYMVSMDITSGEIQMIDCKICRDGYWPNVRLLEFNGTFYILEEPILGKLTVWVLRDQDGAWTKEYCVDLCSKFIFYTDTLAIIENSCSCPTAIVVTLLQVFSYDLKSGEYHDIGVISEGHYSEEAHARMCRIRSLKFRWKFGSEYFIHHNIGSLVTLE